MKSHLHLKEKAISLRRSGKSYGEILKMLGLTSKGTLSQWFKDLVLSKKAKKLLEKNSLLAHERGLFKSNEERTQRIQKENNDAYSDGARQINEISLYDLTLICAALYWGEGSKSERAKQVSLSFSNTDPFMVALYMRFLREILLISEEKIYCAIHLYPSTPVNESKLFWSKVTKLPAPRFGIITQISRASQGKRPFNILPYGTVVIKVHNRLQFFRVKGMINGIIEKSKSRF